MAAVHVAPLLVTAGQPKCAAQPTGIGRDAEGRQQVCLSTAGAAVDIEYQLQLAPSMPTILACLPAANS